MGKYQGQKRCSTCPHRSSAARLNCWKVWKTNQYLDSIIDGATSQEHLSMTNTRNHHQFSDQQGDELKLQIISFADRADRADEDVESMGAVKKKIKLQKKKYIYKATLVIPALRNHQNWKRSVQKAEKDEENFKQKQKQVLKRLGQFLDKQRLKQSKKQLKDEGNLHLRSINASKKRYRNYRGTPRIKEVRERFLQKCKYDCRHLWFYDPQSFPFKRFFKNYVSPPTPSSERQKKYLTLMDENDANEYETLCKRLEEETIIFEREIAIRRRKSKRFYDSTFFDSQCKTVSLIELKIHRLEIKYQIPSTKPLQIPINEEQSEQEVELFVLPPVDHQKILWQSAFEEEQIEEKQRLKKLWTEINEKNVQISKITAVIAEEQRKFKMFKANAMGKISIIQKQAAKLAQKLHQCSIHYQTGLPIFHEKLEKQIEQLQMQRQDAQQIKFAHLARKQEIILQKIKKQCLIEVNKDWMKYKNAFSQRFGNCPISTYQMMTPKTREKRRCRYQMLMKKKIEENPNITSMISFGHAQESVLSKERQMITL